MHNLALFDIEFHLPLLSPHDHIVPTLVVYDKCLSCRKQLAHH